MPILIDSREQKYIQVIEHLAEILPEGVDFRVPQGGLPHKADYIVRNENELGIQRKTVNDFISSLDGLKETMYEVRDNYEISALLIEGNWKVANGSVAVRRGGKVVQTIPLSSLHNFVLSQQIRGTFFFRTANLIDTSYLLANSYSYLDGSISPDRSSGSPEEMLAMFPGIGPKKAQELIDKFGNPYYVLNQMQNWDRVEGIGPATKDNAEAWLRGED